MDDSVTVRSPWTPLHATSAAACWWERQVLTSKQQLPIRPMQMLPMLLSTCPAPFTDACIHRSLALQQYDEAKKNASSSGTLSTAAGSPKCRTTSAATVSSKSPCEPRTASSVVAANADDDEVLCGWLEEPCVVSRPA